jgi:hypothetical protein
VAKLTISDEALDIYREMRALTCRCEPEILPPDPGWESWTECTECQRWSDLNRPLLHMLGRAIPVFEVYVVPPPRGMPIEPERAVERMCALEAALGE